MKRREDCSLAGRENRNLESKRGFDSRDRAEKAIGRIDENAEAKRRNRIHWKSHAEVCASFRWAFRRSPTIP